MTITVASWNVLSHTYIKPSYYPRVELAALAPKARNALVVARVAALAADVICLQEVERPVLVMLDAALGARFAIHFLRKAGHRPDGCATLVTRARTVDAAHEVRYADGSGHVALIVRIGAVAIANSHLKWDPPATLPPLRHGLKQADELLAKLLAVPGATSHIACGDFNVVDSDAVIARFHAAGFTDAYAADPSARTAVANGRARRIDYLLATAPLVATPWPLASLTDETLLPSATEPSDHIPLGASFA